MRANDNAHTLPSNALHFCRIGTTVAAAIWPRGRTGRAVREWVARRPGRWVAHRVRAGHP
jgi:hypothetical protein